LTGKSLDSVDRLGQFPDVEIREIATGDAPNSIVVAPISINLYRFSVSQRIRDDVSTFRLGCMKSRRGYGWR